MTIYLLDTNSCVEYLRNRSQKVITRLTATTPKYVRMCSTVVGELYYGAYKSPYFTHNLSLLGLFLPRFRCLTFDETCAEIFGKIRADLASRGLQIGPYDMQIAAIALAHGLTLVTHNTAEFSRVPGLTVEDWQV